MLQPKNAKALLDQKAGSAKAKKDPTAGSTMANGFWLHDEAGPSTYVAPEKPEPTEKSISPEKQGPKG